jgi:hypothetical protein
MPWSADEDLAVFVAVSERLALRAGLQSEAAKYLVRFKELILNVYRQANDWLPAPPDVAELNDTLQMARGYVELLKVAPVTQPPAEPDVDKADALPFVSTEDEAILWALAMLFPRLATQALISSNSEPRISERTVTTRVPRLLAEGLVDQPDGPKGGYLLTPKGRSLLSQLNPAKLRELEELD